MPVGTTKEDAKHKKSNTRRASMFCAAGLFALISLGGPPAARADGPVSSTGKGIVGGALLGGEVVTITMGLIGIEAWWPYAVFGAVGAAGGGIGGYFVESAAPPEAPLYMLAGGMALVIPAVIAVLNATAYGPSSEVDDPSLTQPSDENPVPSPAGISRAKSPKRAKTGPRIPMAFLGFSNEGLKLGLPALEIRPMYTQREQQQFGVEQRHEVRLPIFQAMF